MPVVERVESRDGSEVLWCFFCPGCGYDHFFRTKGPGAIWQWDENLLEPTVTPSIVTVNVKPRCHFFIRQGWLEYLPDCEHKLAGTTVKMEPI